VNILGFSITRTKAASLTSVPGSRGWWPLIRELSAGAWQRNEDVAVDTAFQNPTLYACLTLIAGDIAKLRPKLVERDDEGIWTEIDSGKSAPVLRKPNDYQSRIDFYEWWMLSKLGHGNTYVLKERDERNVVRAMHILDPHRVTPLVAPDGSVFYQLAIDELAMLRQSVVVPAREIIHDRHCPLFHPLVGISPIYAAGYPAIDGLTSRRTAHSFLASGSRPAGILEVPIDISRAQADELLVRWNEREPGSIAVLTGGMKFNTIAMTAEQSQLIEQLHMTDEDIAKCFHMPRHKVGIGADPTHNNAEVFNLQYYTDCLQTHIEKLELCLDEGLELTTVPSKTLGVEFDLDGLFKMDTAGKSEAASKAVGAGMSYDEIRKRYWDLGPVEGGASPLAQQQYHSIAALARRDASDEAFVTKPAPPPEPEPDPEPEEKAMPAGEFLMTIRRKVAEMAHV
jgi:HK97 family phage portal protein